MKFFTELSEADIKIALTDYVHRQHGVNVTNVRLDITAPYHCADQRENTSGSVKAVVECEPKSATGTKSCYAEPSER